MVRRIGSLFIALLSLAGPALPSDQRLITPLGPDQDSATAAAVLVGRCALAHTGQILPTDATGRIVGTEDASQQCEQVLLNVREALRAADSDLHQLVRIHVYVAQPSVMAEVTRRFREHFRDARPAVTWTVGELPLEGALVMMDAVAAVPDYTNAAVTHHRAAVGGKADASSDVSILPPGRAVYISGQATGGETLAEATRRTLASLSATLEHLGLKRTHIVQVKSFLQPVSQVAEAKREIVAFFEGSPVPAATFVEWTMQAPIEIELVAWAPEGTAPQADGRLSVITPPGMTASPLFARVTVIDSDRVLYTSGLSVPPSDDAERDVRRVFDRLGGLLDASGSDLRHLGKATYYVTGDKVSRALNAVRPDYYDPQRPPAASKAEVRGAGGPGGRLSIDMIAVPAEPVAAGESAEALAQQVLDDTRDRAARAELITGHPHQSVELLRALIAELETGTPEEYRRIPWIWQVAIEAGRRNRAPEIRGIIDQSLPGPDEPLSDWQAVVIGGGIINGISQAGEWPRERIAELVDEDSELGRRWSRSIELASAMADGEDVPAGTRYDALRMLGSDAWERRGEQLSRYLQSDAHDELQMGAVSGLADIRQPEAAAALLQGIRHYSERNRGLALDGLLRDDARMNALLDAVERGDVRPADLGEQRISILTSTQDAALRERALRLLQPAPDADPQ